MSEWIKTLTLGLVKLIRQLSTVQCKQSERKPFTVLKLTCFKDLQSQSGEVFKTLNEAAQPSL